MTQLTAFRDLSYMAYAMNQLALISRVIDLNIKTGNYPYYTLSNFTEALNNFQADQDTILNDYSSWSYCPASEIVTEALIPYWENINKTKQKFATLYTLADLIIQNVRFIQTQGMINAIQKGSENYTDHLFFIIFNCDGKAFQMINNTIQAISDCEVQRVDNAALMIKYLLVGGGVLISAIFGFLIIYAFTIDKSLNALWNCIYNRSIVGFYEVRFKIEERLNQFHGTNTLIDDESLEK